MREQPPPTRSRVRARTVIGAALIVAGAGAGAVAAFDAWGLSALAGAQQASAAVRQSAAWNRYAGMDERQPSAATVPVDGQPGHLATVAVVRIPRLGRDWQRVVRQGVDESVLNSFSAGVGHYPGTAMPGARGNFAIAAHDTGWGDAFLHLDRLRLGDRIVIRTAAGWYVYAFRNFQWVQPSAVRVLDGVPGDAGADARARLITLTTCDPPYHAQERLVAYGTFVGFSAASAAAADPRP